MTPRLTIVVTATLGACGGPAPDPQPHAPEQAAQLPPTTGAVLLDPFTSPIQWTAAPGHTMVAPQALPDVNGDGLADARVSVCAAGADGCTSFLVFGPLRRSMTFPGDEAATLPPYTGGVERVSDVDGDGHVDLLVGALSGNGLLLGPFSGPIPDGIDPGGGLLDVDGDTVLDLVNKGDPEAPGYRLHYEITYGPMARWGARAPDIVIQPSCGDGYSGDGGWTGLSVRPDLVGDGEPMLDISAHAWEETCRGWLAPVPEPGLYDPHTDPAALQLATTMELLPDQTGDGMVDAILGRGDDPKALVQGPFTIDANGIATPTAEIGPIPAAWYGVHPIGIDVNGDGIGELLTRTSIDGGQSPAGTTLVFGGPNGLTGVAPTGGTWAGLTEQAFVEDGIAAMLMYDHSVVAVVDLGPGIDLNQ